MCHIIEGTKNNSFFEHYIGENRYLVGSKLFKIKNNKLSSYCIIDYTYKIKDHSLGIEIEEDPKQQDFGIRVPYCSNKFGEVRFENFEINITGGIHIYPILDWYNDKFSLKGSVYSDFQYIENYYNEDFLTNNRPDYNIINVFVLFKSEDILFYDGQSISVRKLYVPNIEIFDTIINNLLNFNIIEEDFSKNQKEEYNKIFSKLLNNEVQYENHKNTLAFSL